MTEIIEKIKKLHQKGMSAEQIGSTAEAATFAKKVQELINKHKIDMSQINFNDYKDEDIDHVYLRWSEYGHKDTKVVCQWTAHLANMVAGYCNCRVLRHTGSNMLSAYGRKTDLEVLDYMLKTMTPICLKLGYQAYHKIYHEVRPLEPYERRNILRGFKISWKMGFIKGVQDGLTRAEEEAKKQYASKTLEDGTYAMVRLTGMLARVDSYISTGVRTSKSSAKGRRSNHNSAYNEGYETGKSVGSRNAVSG